MFRIPTLRVFFLLVLSLLFASNQGFTQIVTVKWHNLPLKKCLKELKKDHGLDFAYDPQKFGDKKVSLEGNYASTDIVLNRISEQIGAKWESIEGVVIFLEVQEKDVMEIYSVKGVVLDGQKRERLPGAMVYFEPSLRSTSTNQDGYFFLEGAIPGDGFLVARYLGYKIFRQPLSELKGRSQIQIRLEPEPHLLDEVTVDENPENTLFQSQEISTISFNQAKMKNFPALGEIDPFRSVQLLPGIGSTDENLSGISIRGGSGDQSLVLYDGFRIFHLDHFFGFLSSFNADAMKKINIYKGGYPANFGGGASGIVELNGKTGDPQKPHGSVGLNLLSAQATLEVPISKKWSLFLAGRRSYTDIVASPSYKKMMENVLNNDERTDLSDEEQSYDELQPDFYYYDVNGKLSFRPDERNLFSLTVFNSRDNFRIDNSDQITDLSYETENRTTWGVTGLGLSWVRNWNKAWYTTTKVGFSNYFSGVDYGALLSSTATNQEFEETIFYSQTNDVVDINFSWENELALSPRNTLRFGVQYQYDFLGFEVTQDSIITEDLSEEAHQPTIYVEDVYRVFQRMLIKAGVRAFHYSLTNQFFVEPRVSLNYKLSPKVTLKGSFGIFNQNISRVIRRDVFASNPEFWVLSDGTNIPTLRSFHYILGSTFLINNHFKLDMEAYYKDNTGLVEFFPAEGIFAINQSNFDPYFTGEGFVLGLDILFQAQAKYHTAWTSLTIAAQQEKFEDLNDGDYFPSENDQAMELKVGYLFQWKNWEFSAVWIYGSGKPYTAPLGTIDGTTPSGDSIEILVVSGINSERLPAYHRLDLGAKYSFNLGTTKLQLGISLFNAYNRTNVKGIRFYKVPQAADDSNIGGYQPVEVKQLGILPGISAKLEF